MAAPTTGSDGAADLDSRARALRAELEELARSGDAVAPSDWDELAELGYSDEFRRLWEFYLCYCEGGFTERSISVGQFLYARPADRSAALLGPLDAPVGDAPDDRQSQEAA